MPGLRIASNNARAKPASVLDAGVRRLDTVSKSAAVLRHAWRIHPALRLYRHAVTPHGFNNLHLKASYLEPLILVARHLHLPVVGKRKTYKGLPPAGEN